MRKGHRKGHRTTACVIANGCPENRNDGARIQRFLSINGFKTVQDYRSADIILFRPCGGFTFFETEAEGIIKTIQSTMKPGAELIVCGCLSNINPGVIQNIHDGLTFGAEDLDWLDHHFMDKASIHNVSSENLVSFTDAKELSWLMRSAPQKGGLPAEIRRRLKLLAWREPFRSLNDFRKSIQARMKTNSERAAYRRKVAFHYDNAYFIKISSGCIRACSYCAIRIARGRVKSKPASEIIRDFEKGIRQGSKKFILMGTDISSYGKDQGTDLVELLNAIIQINGSYTIGLRNVHPRFLIDNYPELIKIFKSGKIDYIFSAIQSGNDRILKLMKRGYRADEITDLFHSLKTEFPDISVGTQFIVGFPSETDEEALDTLRLVETSTVDLFECFRYDPRPGTPAARIENRIQKEVIEKRFGELQKLIKRREQETLDTSGQKQAS